MKIVGLKAENIKKLKAVEISPDGHVVKLTGANEQGKSSILDAICIALGGTKMIPEKPVREGQEGAMTQVDLGDLVVTRRFTLGSDSLVVKNKEGAKFPSPQSMLDSLIGRLSFDPLEFITNEKKQVETLLSVVNIPVDYAKLQEISGYAIKSKANPLDAISEAINLVKSSRTEINRDLTRSKKTLESYGSPAKTESVVIQDLFAEKQKISDERAEISKKRLERNQFEDALGAERKKLKSLQEQLELIKNQIVGSEGVIEILEKKRLEADTFLMSIQEPTFDDIDARIAAADATNAAARKYQDFIKLQDQVEGYQAEYRLLGDNVRKLEDYKESILSGTKFPIGGLGFSDGVVTYKGLPLSQASSAEKLAVGMAVGMAVNPKLRIIIIRDASLLDSKHMAIIEKMAKENDFQVWMEIVDETGEVGIYIEDGQVVKINA